MNQLNENEQDISFSQGFLEEWLKDAPSQVKEHLKAVTDGVVFYRQKYIAAQDDMIDVREKYNQLTATSAQYLRHIQQQKETIDQLLIESQREFHKIESE